MNALKFRRPKQDRSRESLKRILDAAEFVLAELGYEKATLGAICSRAGLTVGAFYARFSSKEDLLEPLLERMEHSLREAIASLDVAEDQPLDVVMERFIGELVVLYRTRRGLTRALTDAARSSAAVRRRLKKINAEAGDAIASKLVRYRGEMSNPHPRIALLVLFSTLREAVQDQHLLPSDRYSLSDAELVLELAHVFLSYVGARA